jgi:hypothetical protein
MTLLSSLEVIVLAFAALPSSLWELEVTSLVSEWLWLLSLVIAGGTARSSRVVLKSLGCWNESLWGVQLRDLWEEHLLWLLLLWESIVVIDSDVVNSAVLWAVVCSGCWGLLGPNWVGRENGFVLWLSWCLWHQLLDLHGLEVMDERVER